MAFKRKCGQCVLPSLNRGICPFFQEQRGEYSEACIRFKSEINYCEICGRPIIAGGIFEQDASNNWHFICDNCQAQCKGTCNACRNGQRCLFNEHPSPNKFIMETVRQGNMVVQKQVQSPDIVRETCQKDCKCFSQENGCLRQNNCCSNYQLLWEEKE